MYAALCARNGYKRIATEWTSRFLRVQELAEFRRTRPDAVSRPRRGRGRNVVRADARVAREGDVGGNAERLPLRIMSIHYSTKDEKLRE